VSTKPLIALLGNPNTGKTSLFNVLTGQVGRVGNYPGVTVDRREAPLRGSPEGARLLDVPGAYSLAARSAEEMIAIEAILGLRGGSRPQLVVLVADATQPIRSLYLAVQVRELGIPCVIALNMADEAGASTPEPAWVAESLGVPAVAVSARTGQGIASLLSEIGRALRGSAPPPLDVPWPPGVERAVERVIPALPAEWTSRAPASALARWALLSLDEEDELEGVSGDLRAAVTAARGTLVGEGDLDELVVRARYEFLEPLQKRLLTPPPRTWTQRIDGVLLHPVLGILVFLLVMGGMFQALYSGADPLIGLLEDATGALGGVVASALPEGLVRDLLVEGVIGGVGNVIVFVPQIVLLFVFIGILEGSGYLARVALVMDRVMRWAGLGGKAFVPLLSGFACAVPAIMATRTMERKRDRLLTMLVVPLTTCSARLPVYTLIIGALFPPTEEAGWPVRATLTVGMYVFGVLSSLLAAVVLGRTVLKGPSVPFLLELPPYRMPQLRSVGRMVRMRVQTFLKDAGSVILAFSVLMWALLRFPAIEEPHGGLENAPSEVASAWQAEALEASAAGRLGKFIEPAIAPLGFDWRMGVGLIGAFAAREVFVSTMGLVYGIGEDVDEETPALRDRIRAERRADGSPVYTPLAGMSLLVFFALACQCMSTLAAVKRETAGWRWPLFLFAYMTTLAYLASFGVYQGGRLLGLG
jgi:ferrous iron transport protein B